MATQKTTVSNRAPSDVITALRPRAEVPRALNPLPPKSRRRYKREGGHRYQNIGRFQREMRWMVMGKMILPDLRPCWRCRLGADACATCTNARRRTAEEVQS